MPLSLDFSALSDVGRYRKDNQDSGYAGPWLLAVCDGVGGAARGDVASSTAISNLRHLDAPPRDEPLALVAGALHRAHDRIAELVEEDPALTGTSTTAVVALFDGERLGLGHIGDSRAYRLRDGELKRLTTDHTFVQSLIAEGRITEAEAASHPHRNLILKALDANHEVDADLIFVDLLPGDRVMLCSDGVLSLDDARIRDILGSGTPDYATVELIRRALEAGSTDNVTAIVADVVPESPAEAREPILVGAAADLPRRAMGGRGGRLFRGHRSGDTGEIEPIREDLAGVPPGAVRTDPIDPEAARYAPRPAPRFGWLRVLCALLMLIGALAMVAGYGKYWAEQQFYVGEHDGVVTIFRGVQGDLLGWQLSEPYATTNVEVDNLEEIDADRVRAGSDSVSLDEAEQIVENYHLRQRPPADEDGTEDSRGARR